MLRGFALLFIILLLAVLIAPVKAQEISRAQLQVSKALRSDTSKPLRDIQPEPKFHTQWKDGIVPLQTRQSIFEDQYQKDRTLQEVNGTNALGTIIENFDGVGAMGFAPPDPSVDVGPSHIMQMVNSRFQIWDKTGTSLLGPVPLGTIWTGFPGPWSSSLNDGDPIVLYDETADRWLAAEFSLPTFPVGPFYMLLAISVTGDPTGSWYRYGFTFTHMPDYEKFGIWPDGIYMSANAFTSGSLSYTGAYAVVFDRAKMLVGDTTATMQFTIVPSSAGWSMLPSDWDGTVTPPAGSPNFFTQLHDGAVFGGADGIDIFEFHVDWVDPGMSTFTGPLFLSTSPYTGVDGIPQMGGSTLDALDGRAMNKLQYMNFGTHESMVFCHTIDAGGSRAGKRWYELRKAGLTSWILYQEGTYAPADGLERWMGSIAMNSSGDIALGYSVSSSTIFPEIRFTGRLSGDPLGVMTITETTIHASSGAQTGLTRWGDYTQMSLDPDGITFWYNNQYQPATGSFNWSTRIASFAFGPPCPVGFASSPAPADGATDVDINIGQLDWTNGSGSTAIEVWFDGSMIYSGVPVTTTALPVLSYGTNYTWRVDCSNDTCTTNGVTWSFTTMDDPSQIKVFTDDFEGGLGNWTVSNDGGTCTWAIFSSPFPNAYTLPSSSTGDILGADSDDCGSGTTLLSTVTMNTPIDASLYQIVWIEWDNDWRIFDSADEAHVEVSTNGGSTWSSVVSWVSTDQRNTHEIWDVSGIAALQSSVLFRFRVVQPGWDWWWVIDNFSIWVSDIVPVELVSFAAVVNKNDVTLNWSTVTETNNQGFEIQKTTGDNIFERIGFVPGHGTSTEANLYSFIDSKVEDGNYSYRLKQIDYNGTFEYSDEVTVEVITPLKFVLEQNYPNPFNPSTLIKYSIPQDGFVSLNVYNLLGEIVATLVNGKQEAGRYEIDFDASGLSSGIYVYNLKSGNLNSVKKMLLVK